MNFAGVETEVATTVALIAIFQTLATLNQTVLMGIHQISLNNER